MGCFAATVGVVYLLGFFNLSAANKDACDIYATVGQNLMLPFAYEEPTNTHVLRWTHNNTVVFSRQQGTVNVGKAEDVSQTGSLLLKNLQFSGAGTYEAQLQHTATSTVKKWSGHLCVKLPKPQLTYVCDFESNAVNLNCNVPNPEGLVISWTLGKKTLPSTLRMSHVKDENFMCSVENKASKENSNVVHPTCKSSSPSTPRLHCFTFTTVGAVLAGGGCLILLLLTVIIILCCRHERAKKQMRHMNKVKLRFPSLNKQQSGSISPDYETMHATEDYPCPSPKPSPRTCYKNDSQPEGQTVQLSTAAGEQKPSPVPKPRTKITQTSNV